MIPRHGYSPNRRREAHMILKTLRGRPNGPTPLFAPECTRLNATVLLAKSRFLESGGKKTALLRGLSIAEGAEERASRSPRSFSLMPYVEEMNGL